MKEEEYNNTDCPWGPTPDQLAKIIGEANMKQTVKKVLGVDVLMWHPDCDSEGYSISLKDGGWLKGIYDSIDSAILGAERDLNFDNEFYIMQERVNNFKKENRLITVKDFD